MMSDLFYNYDKMTSDRDRHTWSVVGPAGGVHIWACPMPEGFNYGERFYGGVEVHSRHGEGEPHHKNCWLIGGPCWHDGSSLYFSENIEPILRNSDAEFPSSVHEYINAELLDWYRSKLDSGEE